MGYAQWILLNILNNLQNQNIQVYNVNLLFGKFHTFNNKDQEIPSSTISNMGILRGNGLLRPRWHTDGNRGLDRSLPRWGQDLHIIDCP